MTEVPTTMRQLRSVVTSKGALELSIDEVPVPVAEPGEVLLRVEAAPINPSDLGLLIATADLRAAIAGGTDDHPTVTAPIPPETMPGLTARFDQSMPVGNEGSGTVVAVGEGVDSSLLGKLVGFVGGASYGEYRNVSTMSCIELPDGTQPEQAAACFVNPLTALGMVETMRMEGHTALVHTAAASNLGQMLNRLCINEGVGLVNVVRKPEQAELLRSQGAEHVCDSSQASFRDDLTAAISATGATIAFDAIGGGTTGATILSCIEAAAAAKSTTYSRYGSDTFKQLYIYGGLDRSPTELTRNFGFSWSVGGWLLTPFLGKIGLEGIVRLRQKVASEITTTFASHYTDEVSLTGALSLDALRAYAKQATGQKYLIRPQR
ncbi:MAG TPA: zinc-binding dehydrogenase [Ilumatobacteraceae bacterium]|nr:zinc-binding dehydrogenase [Ilumatobacteraceae bacterium]